MALGMVASNFSHRSNASSGSGASAIASRKEGRSERNAASAAKTKAQRKQISTAVLLDPSGKVGRLYDAKTTPHMFVIAPNKKIVYNGAIDSISSADRSDIKSAKNYLMAAMDSSMAGKAVVTAKTKPYGCSVKY